MGSTLKYMVQALMLLCAGAAVCVAHNSQNTSPNIVNSKQSDTRMVLQTNSDIKQTILPVLLVEFEDVRFSVADPKGSFTTMLNGVDYTAAGATGSVAKWLNRNFKGKRTFVFEVSDVITLPNPVAHYGAQSETANDSNIMKLVKDACEAASAAGTDFSRYDNNSDGMADNVSIIFAGYSQAEGGSPDSIWPHQQDATGYGLSFNGTGIASYICTAELGGSSGSQIARIGHFCHEFSHFLGLPDLYDVNGEVEGAAPGTYGTLSVMDKGNFLNGGNTPPLYNAVERELLGLCTIEDLVPNKTYTIYPFGISDKIYRIKTSNEGEYFLLECRRATGWDTHIGGSGLVVYHIDKSAKVFGGISSADRWGFNNINSFATHECVRVIPALPDAADASGVFFPGKKGVKELLPSGEIPLVDWAGHPVGIGLVDIGYSNGRVIFKTVEELSFNPALPRADESRAYPYQYDIKVEWHLPPAEDDTALKLQWLVKWREKGEKEFSSAATDSSTFFIEGVLPGTLYEIEVCALNGNVLGATSRMTARTLPVTSMFPYIYVAQDGYEAGDIMDLRLINMVEKPLSVEWYANGSKIEGGRILLEEKGEKEIMALIKYSDGSDERIYKKIRVR